MRLALFGHTHRAVVHTSEGRSRRSQEGPMAELCITVGSARYLVNPGSVGQPRDGDPRAAFALVDLDGGAATVRFCRVAFDRDACQAKVARAGISDGGRLGDLRTGRRRVP